MSFLFGGAPPTTSELARRYKLAIARAIRDIDREVGHVREQERAGMAEIRRYAQSNPTICVQKAKGVVRSRKMQARFMTMKGQLQEISSRIMHVRSSEALHRAIEAANMAMQAFASRMGQRGIVKTVRDFSQNNSHMKAQAELTEDMLGDVFDGDASDEDEEDEEVDSVIVSVLGEAGVRLPQTLGAAQSEAGGGGAARALRDVGGGGGGAGGAGTGVQVRSMERALPSATRDGVTLDEETANLERRLRRLMRT